MSASSPKPRATAAISRDAIARVEQHLLSIHKNRDIDTYFGNFGYCILPELPNFALSDIKHDSRIVGSQWFAPGKHWFDSRNSDMSVNSELCSGNIYY